MILAFTAGLIVGTVGGMVSWLAAAAYFEAQRTPAVMAEAEFAVFSVEDREFASETVAPSGRLYHRTRKRWSVPTAAEAAAKARNSSL